MNIDAYQREIPQQNKNHCLCVWGMIISIFLNNISQLPIFIEYGITTQICLVGWIIAIICIALTPGKTVFSARIGKCFVIPTGIILLSLFNSLATSNSYMLITKNIVISMCVLGAGMYFSSRENYGNITPIVNAYILSATIVAIVVFYQFFYDTNSINNTQYAYEAKNSIAHVLLAAFILNVFSDEKKLIKKWFRIVISIMLLIVILFLKSRAAYVGLLLSLCVFVFSKNIKKGLKYITIIALTILTILILTNPSAYNIVINKLLFANRNMNNLDAISSGRLSIIKTFPNLFAENWLFGAGSIYFECFPLAALIDYGLIGGSLVILLAISPIKWYKSSSFKMTKSERAMFVCIMISFISDGLFECLAPFGPGAKCYIIWLLIGIFYERKNASYE